MRVKAPHHYMVTAIGSCVEWLFFTFKFICKFLDYHIFLIEFHNFWADDERSNLEASYNKQDF